MRDNGKGGEGWGWQEAEALILTPTLEQNTIKRYKRIKRVYCDNNVPIISNLKYV